MPLLKRNEKKLIFVRYNLVGLVVLLILCCLVSFYYQHINS